MRAPSVIKKRPKETNRPICSPWTRTQGDQAANSSNRGFGIEVVAGIFCSFLAFRQKRINFKLIYDKAKKTKISSKNPRKIAAGTFLSQKNLEVEIRQILFDLTVYFFSDFM
jgi:hypothetical protein